MLNSTNWNKWDDAYYIISRRWFDRWKDYVSYDYVAKLLIEQGKRESDLSVNKILSNNSHPGEISNLSLVIDRRDFYQYRDTEPHAYCNN